MYRAAGENDEESHSIDTTSPYLESYRYNAFNQLTSVEIGDITASYTYRPDGLRHSKTSGGTTTRHIWSGSNISGDISSGDNTGESYYVYGIGRIASYSSASTLKHYYNYNAHGDVVRLSSPTTASLALYDYDAFGNQLDLGILTPSTDPNPFRYCGEYFDDETGSIYLRARYYNPATGRFTTEDPIRAGSNWYIYCQNDPVNRVDPTGMIDVIAKYAVERNGGSVEWVPFEGGGYILINLNGIVVSFLVSVDDDIVNDRVIMDSEILAKAFRMSEESFLHYAGESFEREIDAVMAFGFMFNPISIQEGREYGALIYKHGEDDYSYGHVVRGKAYSV